MFLLLKISFEFERIALCIESQIFASWTLANNLIWASRLHLDNTALVNPHSDKRGSRLGRSPGGILECASRIRSTVASILGCSSLAESLDLPSMPGSLVGVFPILGASAGFDLLAYTVWDVPQCSCTKIWQPVVSHWNHQNWNWQEQNASKLWSSLHHLSDFRFLWTKKMQPWLLGGIETFPGHWIVHLQ